MHVKGEDFDFGGSGLLGLVDFGCVRNCDVVEFSIVRFYVAVFLSFRVVFFCERGLDAFEVLLVHFSVARFPEFWNCVFARGDSMLVSFRLFDFLLPYPEFWNCVSDCRYFA